MYLHESHLSRVQQVSKFEILYVPQARQRVYPSEVGRVLSSDMYEARSASRVFAIYSLFSPHSLFHALSISLSLHFLC